MSNSMDRVQKACERLLEMFRTGELPPAVARTTIRALESEVPSSRWSLGNQLLLLLAGTDDARGFKQWEEVGRRVKKGAKAFYILGPCTRKITEKRRDEEGAEYQEERVVITGFKAIPVFRYEDTEGEEIAQPDYRPAVLPPLAEVAQAYGVNIRYGPFTERFYGYYQPSRGEILLCTHDVDTFFHELAHAVHDTIRPLKGGQDAGQEIVAETVAAVLCAMYGYSGYIYHGYQYIKGYAGAADKTAVVKAVLGVLSDVQQVLRLILDNAGKSEDEPGEAA